MAWRASSSFTYDWKYDVFLSFRGQDVRSGFAGDLYSALCEGGIRVYMDDEELRKGNELGPELFKAIEKSRIAIVVLSKNYAFSSFCLDELGTILERVNKNGRLVLPVFYYVDPSDVRHLKGSYGEAMTLHEEKFKEKKDKLNKWKMALHQAANLNGFSFNHGDGDKSKLVGRIIKEVSSRINRHPLYVANYPVGLESRILQVNSLLNVGSDDVVRMVGIYGIGGIGKTTIARAVYNSISDQFEGLCFLEDVRANSAKHGLAHLQQIVLSEIFVDQGIKLHDVNKGISLMRYRLSQKKVLLVIDDADKIEQLKAIVGGIDWFGPGSRVIITTRDKHLLAFHGVDCIYEVNGLSVEEALDLLTWHAFKTDEVETDAVDPSYADILDHVVTYASGLPLALEIIGSYFFGKSINEWKSLLDKYDKIPNEKIYNILKVSFDSLEEDEQMIFLDIACFFNGHKLANVIDILSAHHGLSVESIIEVLVEKSLIKIDDDLVTLHDLIQDMGKEIVRQESPMEPGKRSRLWFFEDVIHVLEENTGSSAIESLILDFPKSEVHSNGPECKEVRWDGEAFKKMQNLKTLVIRNCHFSKGPTHLPHSLRVLKWSGYPVPSLPLDFCPKKLVILELANSFLERSGQIQGFVQLGVLDFDYCEQITCIPDVSGLQNLEKLSFKHCENLIQIHDSVGFLPKLKLLNAVCCKLLRTFPPIRLTSLEQLDLSQCSNLESFPEILGKMENIKQLYLTGSPIKRLPLSIRNLTLLRKLEMEFCEMVQLPSSIVMLPELGLMSISRCEGLQLSELDKGEKMMSSNAKRVILSYCNLSDEFRLVDPTWFACVKELNLSGNNFTMLPACIKECHFLWDLKLDNCRLLREIRGIPWKLKILSAKGCTSLKAIDLTNFPPEKCHSLRKLILDDCMYLREIRGILPNLDHCSAKNCIFLTSWCTRMFLDQEPVEAVSKMFIFPGTKIPNGDRTFPYCTRGGSMSFWFRNKFPLISLCLVIGLVDEHPITVKFSPIVSINGNSQFFASEKVHKSRIATDHIFLFDLQLQGLEDNVDLVFSENMWNHVDFSYEDDITHGEVPISLVAKQIGILAVKKMSSMEDILFTDPYCDNRKSPPYNIKRKFDDFFIGRESMEGPRRRVKTSPARPLKALTIMPWSPLLTSAQPLLTFDVSGETSERFQEDEVHPTAVQNSLRVNKEGVVMYGYEFSAMSFDKVESEESSSNSKGSDSDDPFDQINVELSFGGKQTVCSGVSSGDASLISIREAMDAFELVMVKDISEVSSDPATQVRLEQLLDLLSTIRHPLVTLEVKEDLVEFKKKAFASFQEFQATVESMNKLKDFEKQRARILKETAAGKDQRKHLKNLMKRTSFGIKAENSRKRELEAEIATLKEHLATKEKDLEQLMINVKNQEAALLTYSANCASLNEQAQVLLKEAIDFVAANNGAQDEGENAEIIQSRLKSTWSTDLTSQFIKIRKKILGRYE